MPAGGRLLFVLPVGHERETVRRLPWVTFTLMGLCVLAHGLFYGQDRQQVRRILEARRDLGQFFYSNPQIELSAEAGRLLFGHLDAAQRQALISRVRAAAGTGPAGRGLNEPGRRAQLNRELQRRVEAVHAAQRGTVIRQWGLIPAAPTLTGLITYIFLHGSWLHLLANLLILYLAGPFLEDVWGRTVFGVLFLLSGAVAGLLYCLLHAGSHVPLVGSSGAIAGLMGAFLVRFTHTRIDFIYVLPFAGHGRFDAPAWTMLPMWFVEQLVMVWMGSRPGGGSLPHAAHVGGFALGMAGAWALRRYGIEERWLAPGIQRRVSPTVLGGEALDQALELHAAGEGGAALRRLQAQVAARPGDRHLVSTYWQLAREQGCPAQAAPAMLALIREDLRSGREAEAARGWRSLLEGVPDPVTEPALLVRMGRSLARQGAASDAAAAFRLALLDRKGSLTPALALAVARCCAAFDPPLAAAAANWIRNRPEAGAAARAGAEAILENRPTSRPPA